MSCELFSSDSVAFDEIASQSRKILQKAVQRCRSSAVGKAQRIEVEFVDHVSKSILVGTRMRDQIDSVVFDVAESNVGQQLQRAALRQVFRRNLVFVAAVVEVGLVVEVWVDPVVITSKHHGRKSLSWSVVLTDGVHSARIARSLRTAQPVLVEPDVAVDGAQG